MKTVDDILNKKGRKTFVISPQAPVFDALQIMADKGIGALIVTENDQVVGIISERDYARKVILQGKASKTLPVSHIMTQEVQCVTPQATIDECMALMTRKRIRHLPVLEAGKLVGVISIGDVVNAIISDQAATIDQLHNYITGKYV